jgi:hypothetical protein
MDVEEERDPAMADLDLEIRLNPCSKKPKTGKQPTSTLFRRVAGTSPPPHSTGNAGELGIGSGRRAEKSPQLQ